MKKLKDQLQDALQEIEWKKQRVTELSNKLDVYERKERDKMMRSDQDRNEAIESNRNLLEIIRWQINPETAKYPFRPEKDDKAIFGR